jgi:uncharacterized protein YcaQ
MDVNQAKLHGPLMPPLSLDQLRRYTVARTLFAPTTLPRALAKLGFVQADPIRAPARAQDLMLRQRAKNYRAGDLERLFPRLSIEEDFFVNYGFVTRATHELMHPRKGGKLRAWDPSARRRAAQLLRFVHEHGAVHPREVEAYFGLGQVTNYWGGTSSAATHLLEKMRYRGLLRVVRRDAGVRVYAELAERPVVRSVSERDARIDALLDLLVNIYAPLPKPSLGPLLSRLRYAVPQWQPQLKSAIARARQRLASAAVDGIEWYWPASESPSSARRYAAAPQVTLLSPFDPLVWDRRRFQLLWNWSYRFEAYTPLAKRKLGYYALPLLWRDHIVGWANLTVREGTLHSELGFIDRRPKDPSFERELEAELARMRAFLKL